MSWLVEIYDGTQHPAVHPHTSEEFRSLRDARAFAARGLGHANLRGASYTRLRARGPCNGCTGSIADVIPDR